MVEENVVNGEEGADNEDIPFEIEMGAVVCN